MVAGQNRVYGVEEELPEVLVNPSVVQGHTNARYNILARDLK